VPGVFIGAPVERDSGAPRIAIKDCIDIAGVVTTAGSPAFAATATPAKADAACLRGIRTAGLAIVGKTNLHELCFGSTGVNPWFGTPPNPFDESLIPGGSSSGSAVAVAIGAADVALGTDTAGSIRTPAACCGVVGYRPTYGDVPVSGVVALSPSLDTVGVLARTVDEVRAVINLISPIPPAASCDRRIGRVRGFPATDDIDHAIDNALAATGLTTVDVVWPNIDMLIDVTTTVLLGEAMVQHGHLLRERPDGLGAEVAGRLRRAASVTSTALARARELMLLVKKQVAMIFESLDVLALPAYPTPPPRIDDRNPAPVSVAMPAAAAGLPAIALPVPGTTFIPASLQLVGRAGRDAQLLELARDVESAVGPSVWATQQGI
jgi:amidase